MNVRRDYFVGICCFFLIFMGSISKPVLAQYGSFGLTDARQLGLGNTYASNSRDLYAAGKNPSLMAYAYNSRKVDILFPNLSLRAYNIQKVTDFFNDFFSQKPLEIISSINGTVIKKAFQNEGRLSLGLQIGYLAVGFTPNEKIGSFGFAMKDYLNAFIKLPRAITEYQKGDYEFKGLYFKDFNFMSSWTRAYELTYGRRFEPNPNSGIMEIYAGMGLKYLSGFTYHTIDFSGGVGFVDETGAFIGTYTANSMSANSDDISFKNTLEGKQMINNVPFMDPVGNGVGFDFGLTLVLNPGVRIGASVTDAGFINWRGKTRQTTVKGSVVIDSTFTIDDIDSLANNIVIDKETSDHFRTNPPTAIHIGFTFMIDRFFNKFPGQLNLAMELHQGVANSIENPEQVRLAAGLDWKPGRHWPVFLTGITNSLTGNVNWSVGIGYELNFMEIYIASPNIIPKFEGSDVQTLSISACWHFVKDKKDKKGGSNK